MKLTTTASISQPSKTGAIGFIHGGDGFRHAFAAVALLVAVVMRLRHFSPPSQTLFRVMRAGL
jgi:hypothetical protein